MKLLFFAVLMLAVHLLYGQHVPRLTKDKTLPAHMEAGKPPIDQQAIRDWPSLGGCAISPDGKYAAYVLNNYPVDKSSIVVTDVAGKNKRVFKANKYTPVGVFLGNSFLFQSSDTLFFVELHKNSLRSVTGVQLFKTLKLPQENWLAYTTGRSGKRELALMGLTDGSKKTFDDVTDFGFDEKGEALLIAAYGGKAIWWLDLKSGRIDTVWQSANATMLRFEMDARNGGQVVFLAQEKEDQEVRNSVWYYRKGMTAAVRKAVDPISRDSARLAIVATNQVGFTRNGKWLYFFLDDIKTKLPEPTHALVDIWSYKDAKLRPDQIVRELQAAHSYLAVAATNANTDTFTRITYGDEVLTADIAGVTADYIVVRQYYQDPWWQLDPKPQLYLVALKDASRTILNPDGRRLMHFCYSPDGKFLLYYDLTEKDFFSYEINTGKLRNITEDIPVSLVKEHNNAIEPYAVSDGAEGWNSDEASCLLYDNYDIWEVDLRGNKSPVNITNTLGRKLNIKFRAVPSLLPGKYLPEPILYNDGDTLLITAFNTGSKENGFYLITAGKPGDPQKLVMSPHVYFRQLSQLPHHNSFDDGMVPVKADAADVWLVRRGSEKEHPNYFATTDFRSYTPLSDIQPQKKYNWLTTELISWKQLDGTRSQGILYKPENFDPRKKYPIIFNYYEKLSFRLHDYPEPDYTKGNINFPWFVSRGYLVFTPDIHFKVAAESNKTAGEWAYNSVVSAARHLSQLPYVDSSAMAIQGHSFGGLETAFLVTHSNIFAAAAEVAGATDPVSAYLTLVPFTSSIEHLDKQNTMERDHELWGATPWQRPDLYIRGSAVLNAHKVTAPVLIMHNQKDNQVQWRQGVEFYMALRRLHKKCWMLQYDESSHTARGKDAVDFTIRLTQFFGHYLKGAPAPVWMTKGIPAGLKGIERGYDFDSTVSCGRECKVCTKWKAQSMTDKIDY